MSFSPRAHSGLRRGVVFATLAGLVISSSFGAQGRAVAKEWVSGEVRAIHFPIEGAVSFRDDWGDPRPGGRTHKGNDIFGRKLQRVLSTVDGTVVRVGVDSGISGNYLVVRDAAGWEHFFIHLNNDSPETDDGANPHEWRFAPGIRVGSTVAAGQHIGYLGDSGNSEGEAPHVHFELHRPGGVAINPWPSLRFARNLPVGTTCTPIRRPVAPAPPPGPDGYWMADARGGVFSFGDAPFHGSTGDLSLAAPVVAMGASGPGGYWLGAADGGVFAFGAASFHGSMGGRHLNRPIVGFAPTPTGDGYWLVASDGGVFAFGGAAWVGSLGDRVLNAPIVAMRATATGLGYWLVASDGGVFAFGDAPFHGSTGGLTVAAPVRDLAARPAGDGYWMVAEDGGVFSFGAGAHWWGAIPSLGLCRWATAAAIDARWTGEGYVIAATDGTVHALGDAAHRGDGPGSSLRIAPVDIVSVGGPTS